MAKKLSFPAGISLCCSLRAMVFLLLCVCLSLQIITSSQFTLNDRTSKEMYDMALRAVHLLTSWSTAIMEMVRGGGREGVRRWGGWGMRWRDIEWREAIVDSSPRRDGEGKHVSPSVVLVEVAPPNEPLGQQGLPRYC